MEGAINLATDSQKETEPPDYLREKPVAVDLLVDTQCRPIHCRLGRAQQILHTLSSVLYYSGQMKAHEIAGVLSALARRWERIDRDKAPVEDTQ